MFRRFMYLDKAKMDDIIAQIDGTMIVGQRREIVGYWDVGNYRVYMGWKWMDMLGINIKTC